MKNATYAHTTEDVDTYLKALNEILRALDSYIQSKADIAHPGFSRLS